MKQVALIVAGGVGRRMNSEIPKQFLLLNKLPVLIHTLRQFSHLDEIVVVLPHEHFKYWRKLCQTYEFPIKHKLVKGGQSRFHSVKNGLSTLDNRHSIVAIHDGVRPLVSRRLINELINETITGVGVIPCISVKDSIRKIDEKNSIYIDRNKLYQVQTPQCFLVADIKKAYDQGFSKAFTDDASVFESNGGKIHPVEGEEKNIKITTQADLKIAELFIQ